MAKQKPEAGKGGAADLSPQMRLAFEEEREVRREEEVRVRCRRCGKRFPLPRWYAEKEIRFQFCSSECREAWEAEQADETFHLRLEGRPDYRGGNWQVQAGRARERDGYRCRMCGVTEEELKRQLDVHHRVPFRTFESAAEANRLSNLISVCRPCHRRLEEEGRADLPLFERVKHPGQRSEAGDAV